jgi:hypothetical protein
MNGQQHNGMNRTLFVNLLRSLKGRVVDKVDVTVGYSLRGMITNGRSWASFSVNNDDAVLSIATQTNECSDKPSLAGPTGRSTELNLMQEFYHSPDPCKCD